MAIRLDTFGGMVPSLDERLLPKGAAAYAENVRPTGGNLRGYRPDSLVHTCVGLGTKTVFRIPNTIGENIATTFGNSFWMEFASQYVDVLRTPVVDDVYQRYYWASPDFTPKYNTLARILAGQAAYDLGIPAPSHAPGIVASGGTSDVGITRAYVTTWVSAYGEEGPAGVASAVVDGKEDDNWNLTLTPPSAGESANRNLSRVRLYRTITDTSGNTVFYFVDDLAVGTTNYLDTQTDEEIAANGLLESATWSAPPALDGMVAMPNGIFAGWRDNNVYFCEPYRPHAWPDDYSMTVDYPIVGLGVYGQTLVVLTAGNPFQITGIDPTQMAQAKSQSFEPCLSRASIVSAPTGVTYASPNGLIFIGSGVVQNVTESSIDKEMWLTEIAPSSLLSARFRSGYLGINGPRAGAGSGFFIGASAGQGGQAGFTWIKSDNGIQNVITDAWSGEIFVLYDSSGSRRVFRFDPSDQGGMLAYTWTSAIFQNPALSNLGAAKIVFDIPAGLSPEDQSVTFKVYADGDLVFTQVVTESAKSFRLLSGFRAEFWQIEVTSKVIIHSITLARTVTELAHG